MIAIDSSAIAAIVLDEPERATLLRLLASSPSSMSALNVFETETVVRSGRSDALAAEVRRLLKVNRVRIVAFDDTQAEEASAAYSRFGKGRHPARLNLCDCAAYALAKSLDAPLLYKGDDFARTDIRSALD